MVQSQSIESLGNLGSILQGEGDIRKVDTEKIGYLPLWLSSWPMRSTDNPGLGRRTSQNRNCVRSGHPERVSRERKVKGDIWAEQQLICQADSFWQTNSSWFAKEDLVEEQRQSSWFFRGSEKRASHHHQGKQGHRLQRGGIGLELRA